VRRVKLPLLRLVLFSLVLQSAASRAAPGARVRCDTGVLRLERTHQCRTTRYRYWSELRSHDRLSAGDVFEELMTEHGEWLEMWCMLGRRFHLYDSTVYRPASHRENLSRVWLRADVQSFIASATAAVRQCCNPDDFLNAAEAALGQRPRVLSGAGCLLIPHSLLSLLSCKGAGHTQTLWREFSLTLLTRR